MNASDLTLREPDGNIGFCFPRLGGIGVGVAYAPAWLRWNGGIEKLAVVPRWRKDARNLLVFGSRVSPMEARLTTSNAFNGRDYSLTVKNKKYALQDSKSQMDDGRFIHGASNIIKLENGENNILKKERHKIFGDAQREHEAIKLKRLAGARLLPKSQRWVGNPEHPERLCELPKPKHWVVPSESPRNIYTDGSVKGGRGGAAYSINGGAPVSFHVNSGNIHHAETQAATSAIEAAPHGFKGNLYTDRTAIFSNADLKQQAQQKQIGIRWTQSHSGNVQHNMVDDAARSATKFGNR